MFCLFIMLGSTLLAQENKFGDVKTLLLKAQAAYRKRKQIAFESNTVITFLDRLEQSGVVTKQRYLTSFRQDGERIDVVNLRKETIDGEEVSRLESRGIWDGETFYNRYKDLAVKGENVAFFSKKKSQADILKKEDLFCSYLDGFFSNSKEHYTSIMLKSENLQLLKEKEDIEGHSCYVLKASSEKGDYTVWIDPQCGYNFRKLTIKKDCSLSHEVHVKLGNINDTWFPCEGNLTEHLTYEDGATDNFYYESQRTNVIFNPNFEEMGAFKMDGIPNGTLISNFDFPGIRYMWQNGKVVTVVDQRTLGVLDNQIEQLKDETKEQAKQVSEKEVEVAEKRAAEKPLRQGKAESQGESKLPSGSYNILGWGMGGLAIIIILGIGWFILRNFKRNKDEQS